MSLMRGVAMKFIGFVVFHIIMSLIIYIYIYIYTHIFFYFDMYVYKQLGTEKKFCEVSSVFLLIQFFGLDSIVLIVIRNSFRFNMFILSGAHSWLFGCS